MKFRAYWERCTPEWVARWGACGSTVRRPIMEAIPPTSLQFERRGIDQRYIKVGHEHLMAYNWGSGEPVDHKSGEPA